MRFFFDRNTCVRTARMLAIYEGRDGHEVRHHDDDQRFNPRSEDRDILVTLYQEDPNWVFVGGDGMILRNKAQLSVLAELDMTYLVFNHTWCNKKIEDTCWMLVKGWPKVVTELGRLKEPSIVELKYGSNANVENKGSTASYKSRSKG